MMVTFVSQCEKKSLAKTRRVLDAFANRIGSNTWQTVITNEGLQAVKTLLRSTASKNTAVSCHWLRSRSRSELVWVVGNRSKFNAQGVVPVNTTQKTIMNTQWENDWDYLPLIKCLTALAALFHDWGKASTLFQEKLKPKSKNKFKGDPLRHEWISVLFFNAYVSGKADENWLESLSNGNFEQKKLIDITKQNKENPLNDLDKVASLVAWLILSHHRLPLPDDSNHPIIGMPIEKFADLFFHIKDDFGYSNGKGESDYQERLNQCFKYDRLPCQSKKWLNKLKYEAKNLLAELDKMQITLDNGAWRYVLQMSRLSLMMGDHYYSSCEAEFTQKEKAKADDKWGDLYANTDKKNKLKQRLEEHLFYVAKHSINSSFSLPCFEKEFESLEDVKSLKSKSNDDRFKWQDKAVREILKGKEQLPERVKKITKGCFIVNMASTGSGKTIANPKIMQALSEDANSMRYVLALGLRTLTLQTGNEYRKRINPDDQSQIGVLIGSKAVLDLQKLNEKEKKEIEQLENQGSGSKETLLDAEVDYKKTAKELLAHRLANLFPKDSALKNMRFLDPAILVCTIDYLMAATGTKRGGKYILPTLRLLSSDLVIDEIDDFDGKDLVAIGRLIHLAGMLGRKVMISSATIPPSLAEGYFNAYQAGWNIFNKTRQASDGVVCIWVDDFDTTLEYNHHRTAKLAMSFYQEKHNNFITNRISKIREKEREEGIKRKGKIIECRDIYTSKDKLPDKQQSYFEKIQTEIVTLHHNHYTVDQKTEKKVSFGVIRVATIDLCIALFEHLLQIPWQGGVDVKVMNYHARQVLLLRHQQEVHLDAVLQRKEKSGEQPEAFSDPVIRTHLDENTDKNTIFILVATPVEEVGRDHDFDWAVVEPSSIRSIIQLAGRVLRHRDKYPKSANVALLQYNWKSIKEQSSKPAYTHPGYEEERFKLSDHNLTKLLTGSDLLNSINSIPRIKQPDNLAATEKLIDLEHVAIADYLSDYDDIRSASLQGWLASCWWLTGIPQYLVKFRQSYPTTKLFYLPEENSERYSFQGKTPKGELTAITYDIKHDKRELSDCLWLSRNYQNALEQQVSKEKDVDLKKAALKYGEITVPESPSDQKFLYSDQYGLKKMKEEGVNFD